MDARLFHDGSFRINEHFHKGVSQVWWIYKNIQKRRSCSNAQCLSIAITITITVVFPSHLPFPSSWLSSVRICTWMHGRVYVHSVIVKRDRIYLFCYRRQKYCSLYLNLSRYSKWVEMERILRFCESWKCGSAFLCVRTWSAWFRWMTNQRVTPVYQVWEL